MGDCTYVNCALNYFIALNAVVSKVPHGASVDSPFFALKLSDELHGANFGRPTHRPCREDGAERVEARLARSQHPRDL